MKLAVLVRRLPTILGGIVIAWMIAAFMYYPIISMIGHALFPDGHFSTSTLTKIMHSSRAKAAIINSIVMALATVLTVNIVGIAQVAILEFFKVRGSAFFKAVFAIPLVFSSVAAVTGFVYVYGPYGLLTPAIRSVFPGLSADWFGGGWAVLFIHTFTMTGYHFLFLRSAIRRVDFSTVEAARTLGQSPVRALLSVVVPVLRPTLLATSLLVLIGAFSSFAAPSIIGGGYPMLAPLVQALASGGSLDVAAMLSFVLATLTLVLFLWMQRTERRGNYLSTSKTPRAMEKITINWRQGLAIYPIGLLLAAANLLPVLVTALYSFAPAEDIRRGGLPRSLSFDNYIRVFSNTTLFGPVRNSMLLGLIAVSAALVIALFAAVVIRNKRGKLTDLLEFSLFIPWVIPGLILAVGLIAAYDASSPLILGQVLVGSFWILPIAYVVVLLPMMMRILGAALSGIDTSLYEAGRTLGSGAGEAFFRITLPLIAPFIFQVSALAFNDVLNEYGMSVMLYNINNQPLGPALKAANLSQDPVQVANSTVYVVVILVASLAIILGADKLGEGRGRTKRPVVMQAVAGRGA